MTNQLRVDLAINPADLDNEIVHQPGLYVHYIEKLAAARKEMKIAKLGLDTFEAALDQKFRDLAVAKGQKLTEAQLQNLIKGNPDWQMRSIALIELETIDFQLEGIVRAMAQKKDMIVTYASNVRSERGQYFGMRGEKDQGTIPVVPYGKN